MKRISTPPLQISIHAPAMGATQYADMFVYIIQFQSTLPRWERLIRSAQRVDCTHQFQSTLPRWERRGRFKKVMRYLDFNPRSRDGSDSSVFLGSSFKSISIHAPAMGATMLPAGLLLSSCHFNPRSRDGSDATYALRLVWQFIGISIHAPAMGATRRYCRLFHIRRFQSTLPRWERRSVCIECRIACSISIHAPAMGATRRRTRINTGFFNFNPRSRDGSDGIY